MSNVQETVGKLANEAKRQTQNLAAKGPVVRDKIAELTGVAAKDPRLALSLWNDTPTRASIVAFVDAITDKG